jgi:hypothetical protein
MRTANALCWGLPGETIEARLSVPGIRVRLRAFTTERNTSCRAASGSAARCASVRGTG